MSRRWLTCVASLLSSFPVIWQTVNMLASVTQDVCNSDPASAKSFRLDPTMIHWLFVCGVSHCIVHSLRGSWALAAPWELRHEAGAITPRGWCHSDWLCSICGFGRNNSNHLESGRVSRDILTQLCYKLYIIAFIQTWGYRSTAHQKEEFVQWP